MTAHTADEITEAMARAIYGAAYEGKREDEHGNRHPEPGWCWERCGDVQRNFCRQQARAAYAVCLRMLREPTETQSREGWTESRRHVNRSDTEEPSDIWRAMIDARLKELG